MKTLKVLKLNSLLICIFVLFSLLTNGEADAATYYVATNGSDGSAGTSSAPWETFGKAMTALKLGDTLLIKDGIYKQTLDVTVSGTAGNPITIKAQNEGSAIVDGTSSRIPLIIYNRQYLVVEGITFKNSNGSTVETSGCKYLTIRRCMIIDYSETSSWTTVLLHASSASSLAQAIVFEDNAVIGQWGMLNGQSSNYLVIRRNYFRGAYAGTYLYNANNCIVENNIMTIDASDSSTIYPNNGPKANQADKEANYNKFFGNISVSPVSGSQLHSGHAIMEDGATAPQFSGTVYKNNVAINPKYYGGRYDGDDNLTVENNTYVRESSSGGLWAAYFHVPSSGLYIKAVYKNNSMKGNGSVGGYYRDSSGNVSVNNSYNNYYNLGAVYGGAASQGVGEKNLNPGYATATYGNGAYLMVPTALKDKGENGADIGAEVLYRYKDGVLTNEPLWPWPMEDRIKNETGYSVTYESAGGLWKTLNGVYSNLYSDSVPPAAPKLY